MNDNISIFLVMSFLFLAGVFGGAFTMKQHCRQAAVKAGVAEYVVNPETGDTVFTYKKPKE